MGITNNHISGLIDELELDESDVYANYSGRVMNGRTCFGFVLSERHNAVQVGVAIRDVIDDDKLVDELISNVRTDSVGLYQIVYFPNVTADDWGL